MKLISLNAMQNDLAKTLALKLFAPDTNFSLTEGGSTFKREQCLEKILDYIDWIEQLNIHSVMIMSPPSVEALCLCYALVLSNKTYIPLHTSSSSELLEVYLKTYQVDLLWIHPHLITQFAEGFKNKLLQPKNKTFFYYLPKIQQTACIIPGIVLFTSGTMGLPKAVHYQYHTIHNYLSWCLDEFRINPEDHVLFISELSFIASLRPLFVPAIAGANITFIGGNSPNKLQWMTKALIHHQITVLNLTPTFFKLLMNQLKRTQLLHHLFPVRLVLLSGEPIDIEPINRWFAEINTETVFYNLYGSTECLLPFYKRINAPLAEQERLHLGQLRAGCDYKLLPDARGYELCIAGALSTAYFDEDLTHHHYITINNRRYLRTKDFVKLEEINQRKELFFCSRSQRLIKRYAQLINLDELEFALKKSFPELDFITFSDEENENKIYLVIKTLPDDALLKQIKFFLKSHFPNYMHPNEYIFTREIPLTSSGKINYFLLKKKFTPQDAKFIFEYFTRFFDRQPIDIERKIVDLGLESIDYLEMAEEFLRITGKWLDVAKIHNEMRIADIGSCLVELNLTHASPQNKVMLNPLQRGFYSKELDEHFDQSLCIIASLCLQGISDIRQLEIAIADTLANHFMLNSKLKWIDSDYFFVSAGMQTDFNLRAPIFFSKKELQRLITTVHADRLVRIYVQKKKNHYFLIMAYHHIALDGWSAALVREEIFRRYEGTHEIKCINQEEEINALNRAAEFREHTRNTLRELKTRLSQINPYEYNHLEPLFQGTLENRNTCFTLEKKWVDQFAHQHQIQDSPYSVIFALVFHQMISQIAGVNKLFFYMSFSNRNLPIPHIKELIGNLATGLPVFFNNKNLTTQEFAAQIKDNFTLYFKNMSYTRLVEIWENEIINQRFMSPRHQRYRLVYTYINKITEDEYIQNKYIDWDKSINETLPENSANVSGKKKVAFLRVYNMGPHFVVMLSTQMKKKVHDLLLTQLHELMNSQR